LTRWDPIVEKAIVPFEEAHMLPPLGRSSSTCKKSIKAWARGMMKEIGAKKRKKACRKEITSQPPKISYLKHGDVLCKLCTQRKCNFAKIKIIVWIDKALIHCV
jgi:hypothetical protein